MIVFAIAIFIVGSAGIIILRHAYLKGRQWQMKRLDEQNKQLKRMTDISEKKARK